MWVLWFKYFSLHLNHNTTITQTRNTNTHMKKRQTSKIGGAGSLQNQMMSNNATLPVVGQGATRMLYTDRQCYEVLSVSEDGKTVEMEYLTATADRTKQNGHGHQNWILTPTGDKITIVWRRNAWHQESEIITFEPKFMKECDDKGIAMISTWLRENEPALYDEIWGCGVYPKKVVKGYTKKVKKYNKIDIIFGIKQYYRDWEF